jgi:serine/threonine protein kinase/tetratricopeptide (TPR) repeat protein
MKPERWQQIERLYHAALERKPAERVAFLRDACEGEDAVRCEIESLLGYQEKAEQFIESPALEVAARRMAEDQVSSMVGRQFGSYKILSQLGAGGMGEVYLAEDIRLNRKVAIKFILPKSTDDEQAQKRFIREAQAAAGLDHPNICAIHEVGQQDNISFIVMQYVDGQTLASRIQTKTLTLADTLDISIQVAGALSAAHSQGIIHRDIKPQNIIINSHGQIKVLDFGLAKVIKRGELLDGEAETEVLLSTPGMIMGTPAYMSPEQVRGETLDARTDIFSFGSVLYEMVSGRHPFGEASPAATLSAILTTEPAPLARYVSDVPDELQRIVRKTLSKGKEARYQGIKDLLIDLRELKQDLEFEAKLERTASPESSNRERVKRASGTTAVTASQLPAQTDNLSSTKTQSSAEYIVGEITGHKLRTAMFVAALMAAAAVGYYYLFATTIKTAINSIAVLPFVNESGNADVEYLSDGMSESLINSLSQLPKLLVKARSSVFRYKGKEVESQKVASELSVQAILNGRFVLRGDDLALYLSLVDGRTGNQIWGEQYNRKLKDLVTLQSEIALDVSQKLRARLSGADEQKLAKTYTASPEAYQLYLKGRYHVLKLTAPEVQKGISYFKQAIDIDPSYALAYVGLADAYRSVLVGDTPPAEFLPKAKAAAQKAIDLDDSLADAHAELGFIIFWYDWDWNAAENQFKRALELDPNDAGTHLFYAHLLSNIGRHAEGLAEAKRARELEPLNLRTSALEGQFLIHAGRTDEALASLQRVIALEPNFAFGHFFASSAYIEKGMFAEAITEARKAIDLNGANSQSIGFLGYALAKSGKTAEARAELEGLLKRSTEHYIPPYHIALIYNGLGERAETLAWLERSYNERDPKLVFLKVEPKWNNLRGDPQFQDLLRRVGFPP